MKILLIRFNKFFFKNSETQSRYYSHINTDNTHINKKLFWKCYSSLSLLKQSQGGPENTRD